MLGESLPTMLNALDIDTILLTIYSIDTHLTHQQQKALKTLWKKKWESGNQQFLLFPQRFLLDQKIVSPFVNIFDIIFLFAAEVEKPKIGIRGKGLIFSKSYKIFPLMLQTIKQKKRKIEDLGDSDDDNKPSTSEYKGKLI